MKLTRRKDLRKIGSKLGGWIVPVSLIHADSICYCVGCGEDISFDLGLMKACSCRVFAFDPTPKAIAHVRRETKDIPDYRFFEIGLWDKEDTLKFFVPKNPQHVSHSLLNLQQTDEYITVKVRRLSDIMKELGHTRIDLLKIDIEGAEYKVIDSIIDDDLDIGIICVEFDEYGLPLDKQYKERIRRSVERLIAFGYSLVAVERQGNYTFVRNR